MKRILVPTDFSEFSYFAAEVAAGIAKRTEARVYLLHALDMPHYTSNDQFGAFGDTAEGLFLMKRAKMEFEKLIKQEFFTDVNVVEVVQWENVFETITVKAKEHDIDLIVMGSHGASGVKEFFVGSNTEKIVRTAHCPVLTIKERMDNFSPKRMVFASNFFGESADSFEPIKRFAEIFDVELHLLKVITPSNFESTEYSHSLMDDFAKETGLSKYKTHTYNEMIVENGIFSFCENVGADLIAIETHGRTGLAHFFRQSISEDIANHSPMPVLTVKMVEQSAKKGAIFPD
jgi:nucleotide-binding universal stress UspA family protein